MLQHLLAWCQSRTPGVIALYIPIRGEPDLLAGSERLKERGWQLALPRVVMRDAPIAFAPWQPGEPLERDHAGVLAPVSEERLQPDVLLAPCLAYNSQRYRLGYGAGYYDRTLAEMPETCPIGVAWAGSLVDFRAEPLDVPMQLILTENGLA